jgi:hypothetical protein
MYEVHQHKECSRSGHCRIMLRVGLWPASIFKFSTLKLKLSCSTGTSTSTMLCFCTHSTSDSQTLTHDTHRRQML